MIKLYKGDILIASHDWVKFTSNGNSYLFEKGDKCEVSLEFVSGVYIIEMKKTAPYKMVILNDDEIIDNFDYKSIQRNKKLNQLNQL